MLNKPGISARKKNHRYVAILDILGILSSIYVAAYVKSNYVATTGTVIHCH